MDKRMTRQEVLNILNAHREEWRSFGVKSLAVFGSFARDEATDDSDVDILVDYEPEADPGLFEFINLQDHLTRLLGRRVDLATPEALRKEMKPSILREAVYAG
jgi:hypothetical protein